MTKYAEKWAGWRAEGLATGKAMDRIDAERKRKKKAARKRKKKAGGWW